MANKDKIILTIDENFVNDIIADLDKAELTELLYSLKMAEKTIKEKLKNL